MKAAKLICLVVIEIVLALLLFTPRSRPHPQGQLRAFNEWRRHPAPETRAQLDHENSKLSYTRAAVAIGLLCALGLNTTAIIRVVTTPGHKAPKKATICSHPEKDD